MVTYSYGKWLVRVASMLAAAASLGISSASAQTFGAGTFIGIIQSGSDNDEGFGYMVLTLNRTGTFSTSFNVGINYVGHHFYVKTGKFDSSGQWSISGPAPTGVNTRYEIPVNMTLQLDSVSNPTKITGNLNDYTHSSSIALERVFVATPGNPASEAGTYTHLFQATQQPDPPGTGWGRALVWPSGIITVGGHTPDGRIFVRSARVTMFDNWPVYWVNMGITNGIFSGWLNFSDQSGSDFSGSLTWIGPEEPGPNHAFVPHFVTTVNVTGSRYRVPVGTTVIGVNSDTNNIQIVLSDGGLDNPITKTATLKRSNLVVFSPHQPGDSLVMSPAFGTFVGTFKHTDGHVYFYHGAILQKQNYGGGQFVTGDGSGGVTISPN